MLFPARSEAIHCSKNRMPKIRLPDNPITFQVFTSIIKKENVPNTDIFRYRIELLPSQEGGLKLCTPTRRHADNAPTCVWAANVDLSEHDPALRPVDRHPLYPDDTDQKRGQKPETRPLNAGQTKD